MIKYLIVIALLLTSCSQVNDWNEHPSFNEIFEPTPPESENPINEAPSWSHFDLKYDALEFLIDNPPMELHQIYDIHCGDKWLAERVRQKLIYEELEKN